MNAKKLNYNTNLHWSLKAVMSIYVLQYVMSIYVWSGKTESGSHLTRSHRLYDYRLNGDDNIGIQYVLECKILTLLLTAAILKIFLFLQNSSGPLLLTNIIAVVKTIVWITIKQKIPMTSNEEFLVKIVPTMLSAAILLPWFFLSVINIDNEIMLSRLLVPEEPVVTHGLTDRAYNR